MFNVLLPRAFWKYTTPLMFSWIFWRRKKKTWGKIRPPPHSSLFEDQFQRPLKLIFEKDWEGRRADFTRSAFLLFFSTVRCQMFLQRSCIWAGKVTVVTFVWLFHTVSFQMCPQIACLWGCIVTLITFVGLFSTVSFQMCSQMFCTRRDIVTLITFVWLFSSVC